MRKNRYLLCSVIAAAALLTSACGQTAVEQPSGQTAVVSSEAESMQAGQTTVVEKTDAEKKAEKLIGEWEAAASRGISTSLETQETFEEYYFHDYESGDVSLLQLTVYEENGVLMADYFDGSYYASSYYGMKGSVLQKQMYDGCKNAEWMCEFTSAAAQRDGRTCNVTLVDENVIEVHDFQRYEEYGYQYDTITTYLRVGSAENDNRESYRFTRTVEVSTAAELAQALQDSEGSVKILLNEGIYDISNLYCPFEDLFNTCIAGKEGARVEICIDDPYANVIGLVGCQNVWLENLILGHAVEPGQCSGNVIQCDNCYGIHINNCKLYGSGAYGIATTNTYDLSVTDSEIYECTHGLIDAYDSGTMSFDRCIFRDTEGYGLISLIGCNWVYFNDSVFRNCTSVSGWEFLSWPNSSYVEFDGCTFENNTYDSFSESEPYKTNCVFK
ncbi:MAG: right-handed parallel beta-helix repeat-containing protein [Acetatifactor sp.]|nr:right-handed parallel beta-helix repeat-containing protein [Acetatifactor sp.]